ncbi:bifunctional precorrin-2 dehydrogenase/sirohydrochlorin ferrochelatase [bacterium]|nr:bifunctional precorrin-2 dehydrogenase/sirohydrochlorin ferrochelatase [bacterium]
MSNYYPVELNLEGKKCLVVGGGEVAERKVDSLLSCGADVRVVAPSLTTRLKGYAASQEISHVRREYKTKDIEGAFLVIGATDDERTNKKIAGDAIRSNLLVNVADSPGLCNFIVPATMRRGKLAISVSTGGDSPALAKKIREDLENMYTCEYAALTELLGNLRLRILKKIKDGNGRKLFWQRLVESDILELIKTGQDEEIERRIQAMMEEIER